MISFKIGPFWGRFLGICSTARVRPDALNDVAKSCDHCDCTLGSRDDVLPRGAGYFHSTQKVAAWQHFLTHTIRFARHSTKIAAPAAIVHAFGVIKQRKDFDPNDNLATQLIYHLPRSSNVVNLLQSGAKIEEKEEEGLG